MPYSTTCERLQQLVIGLCTILRVSDQLTNILADRAKAAAGNLLLDELAERFGQRDVNAGIRGGLVAIGQILLWMARSGKPCHY